jgi:hypothetical protein
MYQKKLKKQICFEQTISKPIVVKYLKNLFKPAMKDNPSHQTIQAVRDNP